VQLQAYVVEDNATIRENLVGTLEELTCVKVAGTSATEDEALAWIDGNMDRWDLLIVDLFLKQGSGMHLAQLMSRHENGSF
jgi:response regulator of citrate/malate metabolism